MRTFLVAAGALLLSLATGCGGVTTAVSAQLSGTYDLATVGDLVFVTSSSRNELRVIDSAASPRDFVRAPNPLEPLSIPVVDHPVELARDVRYDAKDPDGVKGVEVEGPYVYARGVGGTEISIVGADPSQLKELGRVIAPSTVTALAARGPTGGVGSSTLYYATWDGARGTLWRVAIPEAATLPGATLAPSVVVTEEGEAIRSVVVMPDGHSLALATRAQAGDSGRSLLLNLDTLATTPLLFPAPVRRLFTHALYYFHPDPAKPDIQEPVDAGTLIFGLLDEGSCGGQRHCQGVMAVESETGEIAHDSSGFPMVPLSFGRGLINGVTLQPAGLLLDPRVTDEVTHELTPFAFDLMGVVTTTGDTNLTGGQIYFFDSSGNGLRQDDTNDEVPALASLAYLDADAQARTYVDGPKPDSFHFGDGGLHSQQIIITYQGILAGLKSLPSVDADGQRFPAPSVDLPGRVAVGDLIQILAPDPTCTAEVRVSSVEADALVTTDAIPAACHDRTGFTVRAAGAEPYVVEGSVDGYLGRVGNNEGFTYPAPASFSAASSACPAGPAYCPVACPPGQQAACAKASGNDYSAAYFYHPAGFSPSTPALRFTFGAGDPGVKRGFQYLATLDANFRPLAIALDASVFAGWYLPGSVAYIQRRKTAGDANDADLVYVAYPSIQGVLELNPTNIIPNAANAANLVGYR